MSNTETRNDVHHTITTQLIAAIERGAGEFIMPWHRTGASILAPRNITSGRPYQGINILADRQSRGLYRGNRSHDQAPGRARLLQLVDRRDNRAVEASVSRHGDKHRF